MTRARSNLGQDVQEKTCPIDPDAGVGFGTGSPLQRWSKNCFLSTSSRASATEPHGLQLQDGRRPAGNQPPVGGV